MFAQPQVMSMILYVSKFSEKCQTVYGALPRGVSVLWLDTPEERAHAKRGKSYQITQVPSLVLQRTDGTVSVYVGDQKIMAIFSSMNQPPQPVHHPTPDPEEDYEVVEEEPAPPPRKVYQPEIEEPVPKKSTPKKSAPKKSAPPPEDLEFDEQPETVDEVPTVPKSFRAKTKTLRAKTRAKSSGKSVKEIAKEMEAQGLDSGMEF